MTEWIFTEEHKLKLSMASKGKEKSDKHKQSISKSIREWHKKRKEEFAEEGKDYSYNLREDNGNWNGGSKYHPYCPKFNDKLKEEVRNRYERRCVVCGKSEILNGEKLSIHHIDGDKMQGCNGKKWHLTCLCKSCHSHAHNDISDFLLAVNSRL